MTRLFTIQAIGVLAILSGGSMGLAATSAQDREPAIVAPGFDADIAAGAAEDTLQACRARIPKDASIGQLMIAEQSCWRDESDRKPVQAVPGARSTGLRSPAEHGSVVRSGSIG
jgi:hypothetical protein